MQKLEKVSHVRRQPWWLIFIPTMIVIGIACMTTTICLAYLMHKGELVWSFKYDAGARPDARLLEQLTQENHELLSKNASLRHRLDEMTEEAGEYQACEVYDRYVPVDAGMYRMEDVSRDYDRFFRSPEMTARCLVRTSAWFKSHPFGIDPEDLEH